MKERKKERKKSKGKECKVKLTREEDRRIGTVIKDGKGDFVEASILL